MDRHTQICLDSLSPEARRIVDQVNSSRIKVTPPFLELAEDLFGNDERAANLKGLELAGKKIGLRSKVTLVKGSAGTGKSFMLGRFLDQTDYRQIFRSSRLGSLFFPMYVYVKTNRGENSISFILILEELDEYTPLEWNALRHFLETIIKDESSFKKKLTSYIEYPDFFGFEFHDPTVLEELNDAKTIDLKIVMNLNIGAVRYRYKVEPTKSDFEFLAELFSLHNSQQGALVAEQFMRATFSKIVNIDGQSYRY